MPVSALLAESIQVALHHSNSDSDHGDNFAPAQTSTYVTSSDSPRRQSNAARGRRTSARRREQCRINLARYRLRQDQKVQLLNDTVTKLREEVPLLELQRDRVLFGTKQSVFNVVVEYFDLFRHGVRLGSHVQDTHVQQQQAFLRCVIASDVRLGERQGLNVQWRRYSSYFEDLNFQLEHVDERVKNLVTVSAFMTVTISEATLKHIFPHLMNTELGETLLGRRLVLPCLLCFEWDDASSQVVRLEMTVDFLTPMSRVLNSLSDTAFVLGQALIPLDGSIGKLDTDT
ncbi:hypothetical protein PF006_g7798 [Phytophthora fragariae]|nr:hypothetical protein PF006_g7798 [Phytophthora fragariae]KAE9347102.1 hypothetical protein PF008_g7970 [Phytophthora fragariae]